MRYAKQSATASCTIAVPEGFGEQNGGSPRSLRGVRYLGSQR